MREVAVLVAGVLIVSACGGGQEDTIGDIVDRHLEAVADGNGAAACRDMTAEAEELVVISVNAVAERERVRSCESAYELLAAGLDERTRSALRGSDQDVTIDGAGSAVVDSSGTTGEIELRRIDGAWKITRVNFGS